VQTLIRQQARQMTVAAVGAAPIPLDERLMRALLEIIRREGPQRVEFRRRRLRRTVLCYGRGSAGDADDCWLARPGSHEGHIIDFREVFLPPDLAARCEALARRQAGEPNPRLAPPGPARTDMRRAGRRQR
jgi:hypothetical protein